MATSANTSGTEPLTLVAALLTVLSSAAAIFSVGPGKVDINVIWRTDDFGETWTRIVGGIREDAYVNSVREDPNRAGLLYAGTNHGVYISYDDGGSWQELNPDLPDMPITDVIPEHDELAMASHGRGFWVLDNVGPLRQAEPGMTERDLVLFEPAVAYRSANGVVLSWWLGEGAESAADAKLEVVDAAGGGCAHL